MLDEFAVPQLMLVRALTASEPFVEGETISIAFAVPVVGRLVRHVDDGRSPHERSECLVPDTFSAQVTVAAPPYGVGEIVALSFVDSRFARIHRRCENKPLTIATIVEEPTTNDAECRVSATGTASGFLTWSTWTADRAARFVQVVDKLFTIDRLGWYRHVLALRLLVPDEISCGDCEASALASEQLQLLRAALTETLGRPLLAAFMPAFSVTPDWLDSIEDISVARTIAGLRSALEGDACRAPLAEGTVLGPTQMCGFVTASTLASGNAASADAFLSCLLPARAYDAKLSERLFAYRVALCDAFSQTSRSTDAVRLDRMSEPNHALDDRLWQLAGAIGEAYGGLAVA